MLNDLLMQIVAGTRYTKKSDENVQDRRQFVHIIDGLLDLDGKLS